MWLNHHRKWHPKITIITEGPNSDYRKQVKTPVPRSIWAVLGWVLRMSLRPLRKAWESSCSNSTWPICWWKNLEAVGGCGWKRATTPQKERPNKMNISPQKCWKVAFFCSSAPNFGLCSLWVVEGDSWHKNPQDSLAASTRDFDQWLFNQSALSWQIDGFFLDQWG